MEPVRELPEPTPAEGPGGAPSAPARPGGTKGRDLKKPAADVDGGPLSRQPGQVWQAGKVTARPDAGAPAAVVIPGASAGQPKAPAGEAAAPVKPPVPNPGGDRDGPALNVP
jgi:hypothetical protein